MNVLLVGAAGFLGRYVQEALVQEGHDVVAVDRTPEPPDLPSKVRWHEGDMNSIDWSLFGSQIDAVVCTAAVLALGKTISDWEAVVRTNVLGTSRLVEWAAHSSVDAFVMTSSAGIYERNRDGVPIDEDAPIRLAAPYWTAKLLMEQLLLSPDLQDAINPWVLRMSSPFGPGQKSKSVLPQFVQRAREGRALQVFDGGLRTQDFIFVRDAAEAHVRCLSASSPETERILNLGSGEETSMMTLAQTVKDVFSSDSAIENLTTDNPDNSRFPLSIARTKRVLSWQPHSLRSGLQELRSASR